MKTGEHSVDTLHWPIFVPNFCANFWPNFGCNRNETMKIDLISSHSIFRISVHCALS